MARAHQAFKRSLQRVRGLLGLHSTLHGKAGKPSQEVSDLLRGVLVLAFAALDAVVTDTVAAAVPLLARRGELGHGLARFVKENPDAVVECFAEKDPAKALSELLDDQHLGSASFQRAEAIERVLDEICSCSIDWNAVAAKLTTRKVAKKAWTASDVKRRLNHFADRRNKIAHEGDLKPGRVTTNPIQLKYVAEAVDLIEEVGAAATASVKRRLKSPSSRP